MPELPEVETIRQGLMELIVGKTVVSEVHDYDKGFPNSSADVTSFLIGATIVNVRRRAKVLLIDLSSEYTLVIHLKMTGQMVYRGAQNFGAGHPNDSLIGELPDSSTRVTLKFSDDSTLYFNDQRKFGWMRLIPMLEVPNLSFMQKVGPEPLEDDFMPEAFAGRFKRRAKTNIKAALLDQTVVAGVGNIYADESLWGAKISPQRLVGSLSDDDFINLYHSLREAMNLSIKMGGSTDRNYLTAEGKRGSYLDHANVFRKEGAPCPRDGREIQKIRWAGRGTHFCPQCQI